MRMTRGRRWSCARLPRSRRGQSSWGLGCRCRGRARRVATRNWWRVWRSWMWSRVRGGCGRRRPGSEASWGPTPDEELRERRDADALDAVVARRSTGRDRAGALFGPI
ncbi:hypothetical protein AMAG_12694 [Allomyces macrogynus ATCC 38327]|uniref:Uncharacterized protein n=1 Tax=Allomyces macrogynus (strain ATCC 38327) TaxID=578462 RepID=A0A0L0T1S6_ALLM3|nr:hypothetical protein AMAG_12694 [Allomyces macrogynus ATCC 38327]|eukprot:KNE68524.1 hypothetical protein AMAG_12694 [Allomyces macrogynus ATCC 38327]